MLEVYQAYGDQFTMADLMRRMVLPPRTPSAPARSRPTPAPSTSTASGAGSGWHDAVSEAVGETVTPDTDAETLRDHLTRHESPTSTPHGRPPTW